MDVRGVSVSVREPESEKESKPVSWVLLVARLRGTRQEARIGRTERTCLVTGGDDVSRTVPQQRFDTTQ